MRKLQVAHPPYDLAGHRRQAAPLQFAFKPCGAPGPTQAPSSDLKLAPHLFKSPNKNGNLFPVGIDRLPLESGNTRKESSLLHMKVALRKGARLGSSKVEGELSVPHNCRFQILRECQTQTQVIYCLEKRAVPRKHSDSKGQTSRPVWPSSKNLSNRCTPKLQLHYQIPRELLAWPPFKLHTNGGGGTPFWGNAELTPPTPPPHPPPTPTAELGHVARRPCSPSPEAQARAPAPP